VAHAAKTGFKQRAASELKTYWLIACYLWLFFGAFTVYRRLVLAQTEAPYLHYGIAIVEALVIAKVILIGRLFGFGRHFEDRPLIVPVLYKAALFGALVLLFGVGEHLIKGWFHNESLSTILHGIVAVGGHELVARVLMLIVAFIPFFAFGELGRVIGADKLMAMFFSKREPITLTAKTGGEA
jgi:hypothetical protein